MPDAALANGFWTGTLPDRFQDATATERAAAYPVRVKGHFITLELRKVANTPGTAQRSLRGTSVFYASDSASVAEELPMAATGLLDMFTVILVGRRKPSPAQLARLLGARKHMVPDMIHYMTDELNVLIGEFALAKKACVNHANLDSYPEDGSVPADLIEAVLQADDPHQSRFKARSACFYLIFQKSKICRHK